MIKQSLFDKYNNYNSKIILLALKTMDSTEILLLKKGYGSDYKGTGYLYNSEQFSFEMTDKKLGKRIIEVKDLLEHGKTENEIIKIYSKQKMYGSLASYFSNNNTSTTAPTDLKKNVTNNVSTSEQTIRLNKIDKALEEYFPTALRNEALKYIINNITEEEKELLNYFYCGSNYEICRKFTNDKEKLIQLNMLINKVNREVINYKKVKQNVIKPKVTKPNQTKTISNIDLPKIKTGYLCSFDQKDYAKILEIITQFKTTNPNYYNAINKKYSGEYYEIVNDVELTDKEKMDINNSKAKIKQILSNPDKKRISRNQGYLYSFDQKDYARILEIITQFKTTKPNYYNAINKKYSGEYYEIVNDVKLTSQEKKSINNSRAKIKQILSNPDKKIGSETLLNEKLKENNTNDKKNNDNIILSTISQIKSITDILTFAPIKISNSLMFNYIIKHKNNILRIMSIEEIVDCYIDNLECFDKLEAAIIIKIIAIYEPSKISKLINSSYLKNKLQYLTAKEQEYIYLTLLSYNKAYLTEDKISEILEVDKSYLKNYQIMTKDEDTNKLNVLLNK